MNTLTADYTIKRHDYGKTFSGQFLDADGASVPLTGSSARKLFMTSLSTGVGKVNGVSFTITDAALGKWSYVWQVADVDTSGWYKVEFEVTLPAGPQTFPTNKDRPYLLILIEDDLG